VVGVVGAPSASSRGGTITHRAAYYLFDIDDEARDGPRIKAQLRGLKPDGTIGFLEEVSLTEKSGGIKVTLRRERRAR